MLKVGDDAPDFTLLDQDEKSVTLSDELKKGPVVVFFYPKDHTSGCTAQVCEFRDQFAAFRNVDAAVFGISSDGAASHRSFIEQHALPFSLLCDEDNAARQAFGVKASIPMLLQGRVTFVIDRNGKIAHIFDSQIRARTHVAEALSALV